MIEFRRGLLPKQQCASRRGRGGPRENSGGPRAGVRGAHNQSVGRVKTQVCRRLKREMGKVTCFSLRSR
jgi:hypothetical protein